MAWELWIGWMGWAFLGLGVGFLGASGALLWLLYVESCGDVIWGLSRCGGHRWEAVSSCIYGWVALGYVWGLP